MKTKRKLNVRLLRRIQKHILEEPRRFFMNDFVAKYDKDNPEMWEFEATNSRDLSEVPPPCGTAACIAGTANLLTNARKLGDADRAAKLIGVEPFYSGDFWSDSDKHILFQVNGWPTKYARSYRAAKTPRQRVKIACARIDHLIKTGE